MLLPMDQVEPERWVIAGCGYVGARLARALRPQCEVFALSRTASAPLVQAGVKVLQADFDSGTLPRDALVALDSSALCYLAPPPESGTTDTRMIRFLEGLHETRPRVFVYMSTTGVYGNTGGDVVDEDSPVAPLQDRSRRRVSAEERVREWCEARGLRWVILRVPGIYGPERLPLERLRRAEPALRHEDAGPGNRIHVDDLVRVCIAVVRSDTRGILNVGDGNHASTTEYLELVARCAGLPAPRMVSLAQARLEISPGMLAFLVESRRIDNRRMLAVPGLRLRYPVLEDGVRASLEEMRGA
jgi:nucleoside-diphosphate-sugar epimerase